MLPLPLLTTGDVHDRLSRMSEVSEADLDKCENLFMLQGRPRCPGAAVLHEVAKLVDNPIFAQLPKHILLDKAISTVADSVVETMFDRLVMAVDTSRPDHNVLEGVLKQLYAVYEMFARTDHRVEILFSSEQLNELLRIGVGQVAEPLRVNHYHKVALRDYVSLAACFGLENTSGGTGWVDWKRILCNFKYANRNTTTIWSVSCSPKMHCQASPSQSILPRHMHANS